MALPTSLNIVTEGQRAGPLSELETLVTVVNKLTAQMRVLTLKLDADAANTALNDTNYTALVTDVAATSAPLINIVQ